MHAELKDLQHVDEIYWQTPGSFDLDLRARASGVVHEPEMKVGGVTTLRFKKEFAVLIRLEDIRGNELADLKAVERELIARYRRGRWDLNDFFVIETVVPQRSAIIVSNSKHASASLRLGASASTKNYPVPIDARSSLRSRRRLLTPKASHSIL